MKKDDTVDSINKEIANYGRNSSNKPMFRVVWSDDSFEWRKGTFSEFFGSIFLREETGVRYVHKYNYIHERWILEVFIPPVLNFNLPDQDGYEPLYVFEDSKGNYLPPNLKVCQVIIYHFLNPDMNLAQRKEAFEILEAKKFNKEVEYFKDVFEDASPYLTGLLKAGEAIIVPEKKEETCKTN